jgi:hypothetical protein
VEYKTKHEIKDKFTLLARANSALAPFSAITRGADTNSVWLYTPSGILKHSEDFRQYAHVHVQLVLSFVKKIVSHFAR